ncbi:MAG: hypothetical protein ACXWUG_10030 [Polyangiales bacterium]
MRALLLAPLLLATACAPLGDLRPGFGMIEQRTFEVGAGGVRVGPRPYVTEPATESGVAWFSASPTPLFTFSGIGVFDKSVASVGAAVRWNALRFDRFGGGLEVQAGYGWGALTLPLAVRIVDQTWIYTTPRFGNIGRYLSFSEAAGVSVRVYGGFQLRGEVQSSWQDFQYYNRRTHVAIGAAYQW